MTHRTAPGVLAGALLAAALVPPHAAAQTVDTGVRVVLANRLPNVDADNGGFWSVIHAGSLSRKWTVRSTADVAAIPPGTFDLYWIVDVDHLDAPLLMAEDVVVTPGAVTEVRIQNGLVLELADWVPPLDPARGLATAVLAENMAPTNWTTGGAMVLPPNRYGLYWDDDVEDDRRPVWVGTYDVQAPFSGIGLELRADPAITVVRAVDGGPAGAAGMTAGDVILAVDGTDVTAMTLSDTVALIRGPAGTPVVLTVRREGAATPLEVTIRRSIVEPQNIARIDAGIRLVVDPRMPPLGPGGWWGVAFEGEDPADPAAIAYDADAVLLVGHTTYDVYWAADGDATPVLIAAGVEADTGILDVPAAPPAIAPTVVPTKPRPPG
jgi:hypothetical protein